MQLIDRFFGKIAWFLTGVCFAAACSMMLLCGTFHPDRFYDVGEVYDVPKDILAQNANDTMVFDAEKGVWRVTCDSAVKRIDAVFGNWSYVVIDVEEMNRERLDASVVCYDAGNFPVYQMDAQLTEGANVLSFPAVEYQSLEICMEGQEGLSFGLTQIQFRETYPVYSGLRLAVYFLLTFFGFFVVTGAVFVLIKKKKYKISWYTPVHGLQTIFLYAGSAGEGLAERISAQRRRTARRGLFCFLLLFMQVCYVLGFYADNQTYRYLALVCVIVLLIIAILCWERPLGYLNWRNKLAASWFGMWVLAIVSDFIVDKRYDYLGYIMILVIGFLFFMWGNMERREELLGDFIRAIEWSFLPNFLFCVLFRPYVPGYRYLGGAYRPGYFAMYLLFVWIAFLSELDFELKDRSVRNRDLFCILALGCCGNLLWKTQSISSIFPAALAALMISFKLWKKRKQIKILGFAVYLLVFCTGFVANAYGIYHVPRLINMEIKFEDDFYQESVTDHPFLLTVQAAEAGNGNRILYKLKTSTTLEMLTSGRTLYWKAYLRDMNLWGHKSNAYFLGATRLPHNGLIAMTYRYGIFAAVPYLLMLLMSYRYAARYCLRCRSEKKYAFFVLADMLACGVLLLIENLEQPFGWVCWYGMYFVMGIYFDGETDENGRAEEVCKENRL